MRSEGDLLMGTAMNQLTANFLPIRYRRRGFTFTEIMFAVVILGIGFIMIAAIFPVAIKMNSQSSEETVSVIAVERGLAAIRAGAAEKLFPTSAYVYPRSVFDQTSGAYNINMASTFNPELSNVKTGGPAAPFYHAPFVALGEAYRDRNGQFPGRELDFASSRSASVIQQEAETNAWKQWVAMRGDLVSNADPRVGFAVAYSRAGRFYYQTGTTSPFTPTYSPESNVINMIVVVAQSRNTPTFNSDAASSTVESRLRDLTVPFSVANNNKRFSELNSSSSTWDNQFQQQFVGYNNSINDPNSTPATLQFKRLEARFYVGENGAPDRVRFYETYQDGGTPKLAGAMVTGSNTCVAPGTFVIVADASGTTNTFQSRSNPTQMKFVNDNVTDGNARANGRVFRVGNQIPVAANLDYVEFELVPGQDISSLPGSDRNGNVGDSSVSPPAIGKLTAPPYGRSDADTPEVCEVLVLGRALRDPSLPFSSSNPYVGSAMDVAFYSMTVGLKPANP